jgi:D-sedoheptulose 7-phosphate isomerase
MATGRNFIFEVLQARRKRVLDAFSDSVWNGALADEFVRAINAAVSTIRSGGTIYFAGNGGSAADAQHWAAELVSKLERSRPGLRAASLAVDTSLLTAIGNDYGYDKVFERQVRTRLERRDLLVTISTSGESKNIVNALVACNELSLPSILFTGSRSGTATRLAKIVLSVPSTETTVIQELHTFLGHCFCSAIEEICYFEAMK